MILNCLIRSEKALLVMFLLPGKSWQAFCVLLKNYQKRNWLKWNSKSICSDKLKSNHFWNIGTSHNFMAFFMMKATFTLFSSLCLMDLWCKLKRKRKSLNPKYQTISSKFVKVSSICIPKKSFIEISSRKIFFCMR